MNEIPLHPIDGGPAGPPVPGDPNYEPICERCWRRVSDVYEGLCEDCRDDEEEERQLQQTKAAWKEWNRMLSAAREEFVKVMAAAPDEYNAAEAAAWAEYEKKKNAALEAYSKTRTAACIRYEKATPPPAAGATREGNKP